MSDIISDLQAVLDVLKVAEYVRDGRFSVKSTLSASDRALFDRLNDAVDVLRSRRGAR